MGKMNRYARFCSQRTGALPDVPKYKVATFLVTLEPVIKTYQGKTYNVFSIVRKSSNKQF